MVCSIVCGEDITSDIKGMFNMQYRQNLTIQAELFCGVNDSISVKFYGSILAAEATLESDDYWVPITDFLFNVDEVTCANETVRLMTLIDKNTCSFSKVKAIVTVITAAPDNKVEIYYGS